MDAGPARRDRSLGTGFNPCVAAGSPPEDVHVFKIAVRTDKSQSIDVGVPIAITDQDTLILLSETKPETWTLMAVTGISFIEVVALLVDSVSYGLRGSK